MTDFSTIFPSRFADILAKYADGGGATASAQIDAAAGETTSVSLNMTAQEIEEDGQTVLSTEAKAEVDGVTISATADATGENASTDVDVDLTEGKAEVAVEAEGDEAETTATASADPIEYPEFEVQQDTQVSPGDENLTESVTSLDAIWEVPLEFAPLPAEEGALIADIGQITDTGNVDLLF